MGNHVIRHNNFALGGFQAAADWMERYRPEGNFAILQHSTILLAKAKPPSCDIELINLRQRCGDACHWPVDDDKNLDMLTNNGVKHCFTLLNDVMRLYNSTCTFPCCPWNEPTPEPLRWHFEYWPLMAHNAVLFTPRAIFFLRPLKDYVASFAPGTLTKDDDMGTERLFGLFSRMMLEEYGSIQKSKHENYLQYIDPLEASRNKFFVCSQDLTDKKHVQLPRNTIDDV